MINSIIVLSVGTGPEGEKGQKGSEGTRGPTGAIGPQSTRGQFISLLQFLVSIHVAYLLVGRNKKKTQCLSLCEDLKNPRADEFYMLLGQMHPKADSCIVFF